MSERSEKRATTRRARQRLRDQGIRRAVQIGYQERETGRQQRQERQPEQDRRHSRER
jgi:hypothetical protein